ncbi:MAG: VTT domain-containing protein [Myxococcales bacterium]|nr:VTT domain-containing protein [Myxococcales bacterium]MCB9583571.1 VTT domain-containing protein [Polyangiaceae bacterium]
MSPRLRTTLLVIVLAGLLAGGIALHRTGQLRPDVIGAWIRSLGIWAAPVFVAAFAAGQLLHLPGTAFVVAARTAWGPVFGFALAYGAAVVAVTVPFVLTRRARGTGERSFRPRWRWLARLLDRVEVHPVRSVVLLRLVLWLSPPLGYALAFTGIRTRDYVVGSALGLAPCIALVSCGVGWIFG